MVKKRIATFLGPQLGLTTLGEHIYGYSGVFGVTNTETSMISGNTGEFYAVTQVQFMGDFTTGDNYVLKIYLNDIVVEQIQFNNGVDTIPYGYFPFNFIIPPITAVKITLERVSGGSSNLCNIQLTGRIYNV